MEVPTCEKPQTTLCVAVGMKRQREQRVSWSDRDADGDRLMESDTDDGAIEDTASARNDALDSDDRLSRKRAMLFKTNLRFLEKIPPLRDYQRARNGRRGAIDGGPMMGSMMMAALEESFEEASFVTLEPPAREAMVAPVPPAALSSNSSMIRVSRERFPTQPMMRITTPTAHASYDKDDEARPATQ